MLPASEQSFPNATGWRRDCEVAYGWYEAVSQVGPWARVLQAGLRSFLSGDALASAWAYSKASEMGYRTGTFNVAWLYGKALANARKERQVVATGVDRSYVSMLERAMQTFTKYCRRLALDGRSSPQERGWAQLQLGDSFYYGSSHGGQQVVS